MEDFKLICMIMKTLLACEDDLEWSEVLLSPDALDVSGKKRDAALYRLQSEGMIEGVSFDRYMHMPEPVVSFPRRPSVTLKGLQFMEENSLFKRALAEIKDSAISAAAKAALGFIMKGK